MEYQQNEESQQLAAPANSDRTVNSVFAFVLLAFLGATVGVYWARYQAGLRSTWSENNLMLAVATLFFVFSLSALLQMRHLALRGQYEKLGLFVFLLVSLLALFFMSLSYSAYISGGLTANSNIVREKFSSRQIALALETYKQEKGAFPQTLGRLTQTGYLPFIPRSQFSGRPQPRYQRDRDDRGFLIWLPGPDQEWDIEAGAQVQEILSDSSDRKMASGSTTDPVALPESLVRVTYDPTNGTSGGDIWRWGPVNETR